MARMDPNFSWNKIPPASNGQRISPLGVSDFITSSSVHKKYPLSNYPYNIYNTAWGAPFAEEDEEKGPCERFKKTLWWQPKQDSIPAQFLEASSMHGLKYVSQPKRHIIERLFWLGSFLACVIGATVMIAEVWSRYYLNPVIVTFNPAEQDLVNNVRGELFAKEVFLEAYKVDANENFLHYYLQKSTVEAYVKQYKGGRTQAEKLKALDALRVINGICLTQESFLQTLKFAVLRGKMLPEAESRPSAEMEKNLTQFLLENSQPCKKLLLYCVWGQQQYDCGKLFKPIITDYGKCCTFNMLPQALMEYHSVTQSFQGQGSSKDEIPWTMKEIEDWKRWDYDSYGYIMPAHLQFPYRQKRAGTSDGLSLIVDPDVNEYFCPCTDSEGVKVLYHVPLEAPRVADLGLVVGVDREVFLEVNPDLTIADSAIESYDHESRKCYFNLEYKLNFYKPYTRSNCMEECWTNILIQNCSCVLYYAPRNSTTMVCSTTPGTNDYNCVKQNEQRYLGRLHKICSHCKYSCNDLTYNAEITSAKLQSEDILYKTANGTRYDWMSHKISVIHIYMGSDSTVPKLRQKLYQAVDLIANTGGLLGLSIGFSVLSAVEIIYFATVRVCCKQLRKSKKFGVEETTSAGGEQEIIPTVTQQPSMHKTGFNRISLLDNSNFLHEIANNGKFTNRK